jgi:DNA-binding LacI/PurR family transcriptional regulator
VENAGYMALFCNTDRRVEREYKYIRKLVNRNIDGIIYHTYNLNYDNIDFLNKLSSYIPIVFMDSIFQNDPNLSYVITEGNESTAMAVKYLYDQGRRRIAYIKMMPKISIIENRFQGYLMGLGKCGLPLDENLIYQMDNSNVSTDDLSIGIAAANYFLSLPNLPDSIVTSCDVLAIGCMRELKKKGINIPKDIAIVGFDNIAYCELVDPTLTTIAQPIYKLGSVAAQMIVDKLDGRVVEEKVIFPGELIIRESA